MNMRAINAVRLRADNIRPYGDSAVNNNLSGQHRSRGPKDVGSPPRVRNALAAGPAGKQQFIAAVPGSDKKSDFL